jgi:hypothetical protein
LRTSWRKGEHGSGKAMAAFMRPLLKLAEEDVGGCLVRIRWEKGARRIGCVAERWSRGSVTTARERWSRVAAGWCGSAGHGSPKGNGVWARGPVWAGWRGPVQKNSDVL